MNLCVRIFECTCLFVCAWWLFGPFKHVSIKCNYTFFHTIATFACHNVHTSASFFYRLLLIPFFYRHCVRMVETLFCFDFDEILCIRAFLRFFLSKLLPLYFFWLHLINVILTIIKKCKQLIEILLLLVMNRSLMMWWFYFDAMISLKYGTICASKCFCHIWLNYHWVKKI